MYKERSTKFTIKQREGQSPDIEVTRTQYIPIHSKRIKDMPIDHGVTREQFHSILNKAAQPTGKSEQKITKKKE